MRNLLVIGLVMSGLCFTGFAQDEHKRATELYKRGNYKDALVLLDEAIASYPDWYYPILMKGQCNQKLGNYEEALRNYNDSLTLEVPSNQIPRVKDAIAKTYMAMKDYKKAVAGFTELLGMAPKSRFFDLYYNRGLCEIQIAKDAEGKNDNSTAKSYYSKAIVSYGEALKATSKRADLQIEASFQKAYAQYKIGNITGGIRSLEESIKAFQDVITRNPKEQRAHEFIINLQLQIVEASKGKAKEDAYMKTVQFIDRYLDNWPNDDKMLNKKGLSLQGAKKYKEAIGVFELLARSKPNDQQVLFSLGSCQMADKQYKAAIASLNKALSKGLTRDPSLYTYISYCYSEQKTKCYDPDIDLEKKSIAILEKGVKNLSGQAKAAVNQELTRKKENLAILEGNLATDNQNHANTIENIRNISKTMAANTNTLEKNKEMYIGQPTAELQKAIDDATASIQEDKKALDAEFKTLNSYINDVKKCSSSKSLFTHYNDMVALQKARK